MCRYSCVELGSAFACVSVLRLCMYVYVLSVFCMCMLVCVCMYVCVYIYVCVHV